MQKNHIKNSLSLVIVLFIVFLSFLVVWDDKYKYHLGLDLKGGSQLIYNIDVSKVSKEEVPNLLISLQQVIERRINAFGVSEPSVYTQTSSIFAKQYEERLIVELPGITDTREAARKIGETPLLEFKLLNISGTLPEYIDTNINGGHITNAGVQFISGPGGSLGNELSVTVTFNKEGAKRFAKFTKGHVGDIMGIFLDGVLISDPVIREPILGGVTQITGNFSREEAVELANNLNLGALPLPIKLTNTQTVGASLGSETIQKSIKATSITFVIIMVFLVMVYYISGIIAVFALFFYLLIILSIIKLIPIVLTSAGLAGLIMSFGFAVDANILIFERLREELFDGKPKNLAVKNAFKRAWLSIRDANISSLIIALLLFWLGTSLIKGFAFTFAIGIIVSIFSAVFITRVILSIFVDIVDPKTKWLIGNNKK